MPKVWEDNSADILNKLHNFIERCNFMIEETDNNIAIKTKLLKDEADVNTKLQILESSLALTKATLKSAEKFSTKKKDKALTAIRASIYRTGEIIPASRPIMLEYETPSHALFLNDKGSAVNLIEGGAFRAILSLFLRQAVLQHTSNLQTIFSDEGLSVLNQDRSADFSKYLPILGKYSQIILIEQKDEIFAEADAVVYYFQIEDGVTRVRKM